MRVVFICFLLVVGVWGDAVARNNRVVGASDVNEDISGTELMQAFLVRRQVQSTITPGLRVPGLNYLLITHVVQIMISL